MIFLMLYNTFREYLIQITNWGGDTIYLSVQPISLSTIIVPQLD